MTQGKEGPLKKTNDVSGGWESPTTKKTMSKGGLFQVWIFISNIRNKNIKLEIKNDTWNNLWTIWNNIYPKNKYLKKKKEKHKK